MPAVRGQGQWALGYREPLNPNEQVKKDSDPLTVKQRVLDIYSKQGFDSIDGGRPARPAALVRALHAAARGHPGRQDRDPGAGGARGAVLHAAGPHRRRAAHHRAAAGHRRDRDRVRARRRRHHRPPEHPAALDPHRGRAGRSGSGSRPSASARRRPAATRPASSSAARSPASTPTRSSTRSGAIREVTARYLGDPAFSNLPRKFKTSISGCPVHCTNHEINDIAFVGVVHPTLGPGYDLWVGGGLSTNPKLGAAARRLRRAGPGRRGVGGRHPASSATTATAGRARTPA